MPSREQLERSAAIRESYRLLPIQGFWTWLTGKELVDRRTARSVSPIECTAWAALLLIGGVSGSVAILTFRVNPAWLIVSVTLAVSAARNIVATIIHHGVHNAVFTSARANRLLCEILSTVTVVPPFDSYRRFHVYEHHGHDFSTMGDQDLAAIYTLGLRPYPPKLRNGDLSARFLRH